MTTTIPTTDIDTETLAALRALRESLPDRWRSEIIEGELIVTPSPKTRHQIVLMRLIRALQPSVREGWLIMPGEIRPHDEIFYPDLMGWRPGRDVPLDEYATHEQIPDWCAEIISPSSRRRDREQKVERYAAHGIGHYWILDPWSRTVDVYAGTTHLVQTNAASVLPPLTYTIDVEALWP
jgi:Uma2 family endonuclease